jgi:tetratricopeptide (TPR) repeat protein
MSLTADLKVGLSVAFALCITVSGHAAAQTLASGFQLVVRPDGSTERALQWVEAVLAHQPGVSDRATASIASWSDTHVRSLLVELDAIRRIMRDPHTKVFPLPIEFDRGSYKEIRYRGSERDRLDRAAGLAEAAGMDDTDLVARAILLHTDIALLAENGAGLILRLTDGRPGNLDAFTDHWRMTRDLESSLDRRAGRDADLAHWYRATLATMVSVFQWNTLHVDRALSRFADDAELQVLAGCLHEQLASPAVQSALATARVPPGSRIRIGSVRAELDEAADRLKRALALNDAHAEARLHYGRVLTLSGRHANAVTELRRALTGLRESLLQYYGQLFLGAALEGVNQFDNARAAYRAAAALFPRAQAPLLALSYLAASAGDRDGATAATTALAALPSSEDERPDPWWTYLASCGRQAPQVLEAAQRRLATPRREPGR